jgi:hypothetical protein
VNPLTIEQIKARKRELQDIISVQDMLNRYGVKVSGNRCQGFCHNGKDMNMKISKDSCYCYVCNKKQDIFDIVQHFESCDFWTAFCLLGGDSEPTPQAIERSKQAQKERERQIALENQKKAELRQITTLITAYRNIMEEENRMSELYTYCYNKCQYQLYLLEMYNEKR